VRGESGMMTCGEFLERYAEFRDGEEGDRAQVPFLRHLEECEGCSRYHSVLRKGVEVLRSSSELKLRSDFQERLRHRIYQEDLEALRRRTPGTRLGFGTLGWAVAALLAAIAIGEFLAPPPALTLPPVQARAPLPTSTEGGQLDRRPAFQGGARWGMSPENFWAHSPALLDEVSPLPQRGRAGGNWVRVDSP